jgi:3-deoxy-D-manno-octulosonic-acid transferase
MSSSVFSRPFFLFYRLVWRLARPLLKRSKRLADGWQERFVPADWLEPDLPASDTDAAEHPADIWLQAASGGEARLAVAVCRALSRERAFRVLIATWTRQGRDVVEKALPSLAQSHPLLRVAVRFAPFDQPDVALRAVRLARPRVLALLETELWPSLMAACREENVPVFVLNGRINASTVRFGRVFASFMRDVAPRRVCAIAERDRQGFASIFGCPTEVMPNIKFDLAAELLDAPLSEASQSFVPGGPVFLFASVRDCEETRLPEHFSRILKAEPEARIVIVPRHLHRVEEWKKRLGERGFDALLVTKTAPGQPVPRGCVLIWDRFGDLPGLYAAAQAVFVGGSFGMGGQNFLESLAAGRVPCICPSAENFLWAMDSGGLPSLEESGLLRVAPTPEAVMDAMLELASSPLPREAVRERFRAWLEPRLGTSARCAALLEQAAQEHA